MSSSLLCCCYVLPSAQYGGNYSPKVITVSGHLLKNMSDTHDHRFAGITHVFEKITICC